LGNKKHVVDVCRGGCVLDLVLEDEMTGKQMTIFDWMPTMQQEPEVGEYVKKCGAVIPHIMRRSYIGQKVLVNTSTQSLVSYKCGILKDVIKTFYWHGDQRIECDRSIVSYGRNRESLITHMPGQEIYECLPWDAYEKRMEAIGRRKNVEIQR